MRSALLQFVILAALPFVSCQSAFVGVVPIKLGERLPVEYEGRVATESWLTKACEDVPVPTRESDLKAAHSVEMSVYVLDLEVGEQVTGEFDGRVIASSVDVDSVKEVLDRHHDGVACAILHRSEVTLAARQAGHLAIVNQVAYVDEYEIHPAPGVHLVDPRIEVARDGLLVLVEPGEQSIRFDLVNTRLQRPIPTVEVVDQHTGTDALTLQVPVYSNHRVRVDAPLADDDRGVLISGVPVGPNQVVFVLLHRKDVE